MMMKEKEGVNTRTYIQERRHLPFSNSIRRERENNLHKALSNRGKEKKWIFRQNLVELVKEEKK